MADESMADEFKRLGYEALVLDTPDKVISDRLLLGDVHWMAATAACRNLTVAGMINWITGQRELYDSFAGLCEGEPIDFNHWLVGRMPPEPACFTGLRPETQSLTPTTGYDSNGLSQSIAPEAQKESPMLEQMIANLDRAQVVALLSDETVPLDSVKVAVCAVVGGDTAKLTAMLNGGAAPIAAAPAAAATSKRPKAPAKPAPAAARGAADTAVQAIIGTGAGFAVSDVVEACGCSIAQASGAIKRAMSAGTCKKFGERRFTRYGKTEAAARKRSMADRGTA